MDASKFFPSKWLKAEDVGERKIALSIERAESQVFGQGEESEKKLILFFEGIEKGLVLNRTNFEKLAEAYGTETDLWIGKKIELYTALVSYKKKEVPALRLRILS